MQAPNITFSETHGSQDASISIVREVEVELTVGLSDGRVHRCLANSLIHKRRRKNDPR